MCRAECICKLSVYMKTEAAYVPPHPFTEAEVHTHFCQPSVLSAQRKGGGISKGGNPGSPLWLRAKGTHRIDCRLRKNKPDTKKAYYKRSDSDNHNYSLFFFHYSFLPVPLWLRAEGTPWIKLSPQEKQTSHAQTTPTTFNITYRRGTRVYARTTERV